MNPGMEGSLRAVPRGNRGESCLHLRAREGTQRLRPNVAQHCHKAPNKTDFSLGRASGTESVASELSSLLCQLSDRGVTFPNLCREFFDLPGICWH
jgi:hypothetical protein